MRASRLALPNAAPTFLPTSVSLFFFAIAFLLFEVSSYTQSLQFSRKKLEQSGRNAYGRNAN
jgi:hypothetical protein